jgi:hypothetical protein
LKIRAGEEEKMREKERKNVGKAFTIAREVFLCTINN